MQLYCIQCNSANVQLSPGTAQRYEYWEISLGAILEAGYHSKKHNETYSRSFLIKKLNSQSHKTTHLTKLCTNSKVFITNGIGEEGNGIGGEG